MQVLAKMGGFTVAIMCMLQLGGLATVVLIMGTHSLSLQKAFPCREAAFIGIHPL